jgi:DAK2 domain fusion protein YloV
VAILYCGARRFRQIITAGADRVTRNRDYLNRINVFPVPDGDTGSNMAMTLAAAVREMEGVGETSLEAAVKAAAWGALMGARGNSGIILSQVLSGLTEGIEGRDRLFAEDIALGLSRGIKKAYKAVLHPKEGTILTVIRETAERAVEAARSEKDFSKLIEGMVESAKSSVERTPSLLPALAEAGVVDAGGQGFLCFLEGMLRLMQGEVGPDVPVEEETAFEGNPQEAVEHHWNSRYCTEFVLKGSRISEDAIKAVLADMGDSVVVVGDTRLARVHVHTGRPEEVLHYASTLGRVSSIKVDDMLVQHTARFGSAEASKATSVIAVALGDGFKELFYNGGAELVVDGGPTFNPSTADMAAAIEEVASPNVIILPNNKNIYPAAVQAGERSPKRVFVLKTATLPEGLSAMLAYMDDATTEENLSRMEQAIGGVKSGETTSAGRDVILGPVEVRSGDSIGIFKGKVRCSSLSREEAVLSLVEQMSGSTDEMITLFYGDSVTKEEAELLRSILQSRHEGREIELYYGGQPYGHYVVSVE